MRYNSESPNENYLFASTSTDATIRLWVLEVQHRTDNSKCVELLNSPLQSLTKFVTWSPDGATIATATEGIYFQLWSGVSGKARNNDGLGGHVSGLTGAAFAPYGQTELPQSSRQTRYSVRK